MHDRGALAKTFNGEYRFDPFRNRYNVSQQPVMSVNLTPEIGTFYKGRGLSAGRWNFLRRDRVSS